MGSGALRPGWVDKVDVIARFSEGLVYTTHAGGPGGGAAPPKTLITPALFSRPLPTPHREKRENSKNVPAKTLFRGPKRPFSSF